MNELQLFYSYAHADEEIREKLDKHLGMLRGERLIQPWVDRKMTAGRAFDAAIESALRSSQIVLLLISADYVGSDYCQKELEIAMELHREARARVVPIILRPCDWRLGGLEKILALPTDGKPLTHWPTIDDGLYKVAIGIRAVVEELRRGVVRSPAPTGDGVQWQASGRQMSGDLIAKLCDRGAHDALFARHCRHWLRTRPSAPQIYVVPGEETQRHESLVDRWHQERLPEVASDLGLANDAAPLLLKPRWPNEGPEDARRWALAEDVFRCARSSAFFDEKDLSAARLKSARILCEAPFVVVRQMILEEQWPRAVPLIKWYVGEFWAKADDQREVPRFIVILNVVYRVPTPPRFSRLARSLGLAGPSLPMRIKHEIRALFPPDKDGETAIAACPTAVLPELPSVHRCHVQEWFDRLDPGAHRYTLEYRDNLLDDLFTSAGQRVESLPMRDIEKRLDKVLMEIAL